MNRSITKLWENTEYFRSEMQSLGFDTGVSPPQLFLSCVENHRLLRTFKRDAEARCNGRSHRIPNGCKRKASSNPNVCRSHSEDLDEVLRIFESAGKNVGLI